MEKPILFSGPMIKAILNGSKTQTRRVIKGQPKSVSEFVENGIYTYGNHGDEPDDFLTCPYGRPGNFLWVKETTWRNGGFVATDPPNLENEGKVPSIFMPREASRITLKLVSVRVEQLQDISEEGARAEGVEPFNSPAIGQLYKPAFCSLWNEINGKRPGCSWQDNPWVWVLEFERVEGIE